MEQLPKTPNGKIDRNALPVPDARTTCKHYQAPRDTIELQLAHICENVLEVRPIGIFENFFELGGQSLLAVRLRAQIKQQLEKHLPLATRFQNATIEQLALKLRQPALPWYILVLVGIIQAQGEKPPLFCVHSAGSNVLC